MDRLPGFRDFFPEPLPQSEPWSAEVRGQIFGAWREAARRYGFREYDGPPLEPLELYTLKSGDEIVDQLYNFQDKRGRTIALRPEMTPTLARMVAARERGYRKPIKWFAIPQLFRYERQQKGRLREHFQFNADIFGESDRGADAELIALLIDSLRLLGLGAEDFVIRLSSRNAWADFYRAGGGDPSGEYAFYQAIDKLERDDPAQTEMRLRELGFALGAVQDFLTARAPTPELEQILENLSARGLGAFVRVDYQVIRGLAYYTGPVFEAFDRKGEFRAIAGGGRYDGLVGLISGGKVDLPGLGFGMGDVVLTELLKRRGLLRPTGDRPDVFCLIDDESGRKEVLALVQRLRESGLRAEYSLTTMKADKQLRRALESGARCTARLEPEPGLIRLRDLRSRAEEVVALAEVVAKVQALSKSADAGVVPGDGDRAA